MLLLLSCLRNEIVRDKSRMYQMICFISKRQLLAKIDCLNTSFSSGELGIRKASFASAMGCEVPTKGSPLILSPPPFVCPRFPGSDARAPPEFRVNAPNTPPFTTRSVSFGCSLLPLHELCVMLPIPGVLYDTVFTFLPLNLRSLFEATIPYTSV